MSLLGAIQDLLFPPLCLGCSRRLDHSRPPLFCSDCRAQLVFITSPRCPCCGVPYTSGVDHLCGDCLGKHNHFDLARSLLLYRPPADKLILGLKFGGQLSGLHTLSTLTKSSPAVLDLTPPDYLIPVPLHGKRLRQRGYNQSALLARGCFPQWKSKLRLDLLSRDRHTPPQSHLSGKERRQNLKGAFSLDGRTDLDGKTVLLIDDVLTTGSTVNECAKILRSKGAGRIEVFTLARSLAQATSQP
nr:ComF family protein [uncultured Desulfobulbus sp.]